MVGLKVMILKAKFPPGGGAEAGSGSEDSKCGLGAGSKSKGVEGTAGFCKVGAGVEFMASSGAVSSDMLADKLMLDTQMKKEIYKNL